MANLKDQKLFFYDTETTGTNAKLHSMVQLAGIVEINGNVVEEIDLRFKPHEGREITEEALEVTQKTVEDLMAYPDARLGLAELKAILGKYVNKFDKNDKFVPVGYNIGFDTDFLIESFRAIEDKYGIGSYLFHAPIDIRSYVGEMIARRKFRARNYKLGTVCYYREVELCNAHDALADIRATRELYYDLKKELGWV